MSRTPWQFVVRLLLVLTVACSAVRPCEGQSASNVLVVINENSPASVQVGDYYVARRAVPLQNVVRLRATTEERVDFSEYRREIEQPVGAWLSGHALQDQILYIVLTTGVPLRINGTAGADGTRGSVDSELTLLYRKLVGATPPVVGRVPNPLYAPDEAARPVTRRETDIYMVTRLDGFSVRDVLGLIDRGLEPEAQGTVVLDQRAITTTDIGDRWLRETADRLQASGSSPLLESTTAQAQVSQPVLGYASWGSNDPANRQRNPGLTFVPGALAVRFLTDDGRTFQEPPENWAPGSAPFAGSAGALAGDLVRAGATGVSAYAHEPLLDATVRPQVVFPAYLGGLNLAEAFYRAIPHLSWQSVVIGDPLCAPFRRTTLGDSDIHGGLDAELQLPALFAERRLALLTRPGFNAAGVRRWVEAEGKLARGETQGVETVVAAAALAEPRLTAAQLWLAAVAHQRKEYDQAILRYRLVIEHAPQHVVALNNLAYLLAVEKQSPAEAQPFAERAVQLAGQAPDVVDTLGWIYHLLGDDRRALALLEEAARGGESAEILFHVAVVRAKTGNGPGALAAFNRALVLGLDAQREDVAAFRQTLPITAQ